MSKELLPIGSVIELDDGKKLIIICYEQVAKNKFSYLWAGYPSYFLTDLIPLSKKKWIYK